jgi:GTPase
MRKKAKVHEDLEFYSVMRAIEAIEECDVALLMIDAQTGVEAQDMAIFRLAIERKKGIVILVNKWDLVEGKEANTARDREAEIRTRISPFNDVPIIFVSAKEKQRVLKSVETALEVFENRSLKIKTSALNDWLEAATAHYQPPAHRGNLIKIKYVTQIQNLHYPVFQFFCNHPKHVPENYRRYLENKLREKFNFSGTPIALIFKEK